MRTEQSASDEKTKLKHILPENYTGKVSKERLMIDDRQRDR